VPQYFWENVYQKVAAVWGEPESCVKNDRNGAGTDQMERFEVGAWFQTSHLAARVPGLRIAFEANIHRCTRDTHWGFTPECG
jgi:hypothetical protein